MIIIEGPDHTGKTTLAKIFSDQFNYPYYHFTRESTYQDYLKLLCDFSARNSVVDRWIFSEQPYSVAMARKFAFTLKEWHNIVLLTLANNPLIILCTHKPMPVEYSASQYLPYGKWDLCLGLYRRLFNYNLIKHIEYDYRGVITPNSLSMVEYRLRELSEWWVPMWKNGYGFIGSHNPDVLLVAERIGPNNVNNLPFETGPTGHMLSDMLERTKTPLGKFAVTNMVKSFRRDTRPPNDNDVILLTKELAHLKPEIAVFMGAPSKQHGMKIAKDLGIKTAGMTHFGYYSHRGIADVTPLCNQWKEITTKEVEIAEEAGHRTIISST